MPFTVEQFLGVFAAYNKAVFPSPLFLNLAALAAIFFATKPNRASGKVAAAILSVFWLWSGLVYHLLFFTRINRLAYLFSGLFILQAAIIFYSGVIREGLGFRFRKDTCGLVGSMILLFALVFYPLLGYFFDHSYPESPTFGVPCPTTIFTFGFLLWTDKKVPFYVLIIPVLWTLIGVSAAFLFTMYEDLGLPAAAIAAVLLMLRRSPTRSHV